MSGFKGQIREPRESARARRNSQNLASTLSFIDPNSAIAVGADGTFQLNLASSGGLEEVSAAVGIKLDTDPGLVLSASGLTVLLQGVLFKDASGIGVTLGTGLQDNAGTLETNDSQIVHDNLNGFVANEHIDHSTVTITAGTGLSGGGDLTASRTVNLDPAAAATIGGVLEAGAVADLAQTISNPPTQAEVQAISDKVDELLAAMRAAGQLAT